MASNTSIKSIQALEVLDSRGFPTVAATVTTAAGVQGTAMVPSGASTGEHEAHELRDGDTKRYQGKGVQKAVANVREEIARCLQGVDVLELREIDRRMIELDGTENKSRLGANAILAVSLACAHAAANASGTPLFRHIGGESAKLLPIPLVNVINGGAHAANSIDFQEFMLVPHASRKFSENVRIASEVFHTLKKILKKKNLATAVGDEGGFAPDLPNAEAALTLLVDAITDAGYTPGKDVALALDVASSEFFDADKQCYTFKKSSKQSLSSSQLVDLYESWLSKYPLVSIEDGLDQNDWAGWEKMTARIGSKLQLVGDDLFVTNTKRLDMGIKRKAGNAILVKLNQIGSVSETIDAVNLAHKSNYRSIMSHRSGETEDCSIADLAVALHSGQIKTGSVCRSERNAKYNRLLWIEQYLGDAAYCESPFKR